MNQPQLKNYITQAEVMSTTPDQLSDVEAALNEAGIFYWTNHEDDPICLTITTEHTHQSAFGVRAKVLIAQHNYNKDLLDYFREYPVVANAKNVIWSHPRAHRFSMLVQVLDLLKCSPEEYANLIVDMYTEIFDRGYCLKWRDLITANHEVLRAACIPLKQTTNDAPLTIYHGVEYDCDDDEFYPATAWTLDKAIAEKFARRFSADSPRPVLSISSTTRDIYSHASFYTNARNEQELYIPDIGDMDIILTQ